MKIEAISAKIPSRKVTNGDILNLIEKYNTGESSDNVIKYQHRVLNSLQKAGSQTRYYRSRIKKEIPFKFVTTAMADCLAKANLAAHDIDLLIFCGVGKGFLEPANAYFYASSMKMTCPCFDVSDACMSWIRSIEIAYNFLKNNVYKRIMIINSEFTVYEHGYPEVFKVQSAKKFAYTFPAYTIGEAATATILSQSERTWRFDFKSLPDQVYLCSIPLKGYEGFCEESAKLGLNGTNGFVAFGRQLYP